MCPSVCKYQYAQQFQRKKWRYPGVPIPERLKWKYKE
jgi:hypothetical protein